MNPDLIAALTPDQIKRLTPEQVRAIQRHLIGEKLLPQGSDDGQFGPSTSAALDSFRSKAQISAGQRSENDARKAESEAKAAAAQAEGKKSDVDLINAQTKAEEVKATLKKAGEKSQEIKDYHNSWPGYIASGLEAASPYIGGGIAGAESMALGRAMTGPGPLQANLLKRGAMFGPYLGIGKAAFDKADYFKNRANEPDATPFQKDIRDAAANALEMGGYTNLAYGGFNSLRDIGKEGALGPNGPFGGVGTQLANLFRPGSQTQKSSGPPPAPYKGARPDVAREIHSDLGGNPGNAAKKDLMPQINKSIDGADEKTLQNIAAKIEGLGEIPKGEALRAVVRDFVTNKIGKPGAALSIGVPLGAGLASYFAPDTAQAAAKTVGDAYERNVPEPARNALSAVANATQFGDAREMPSEQEWRRQLPEVAARTDALDAQRAQERKAAEESRYSSILDAVQRQAPDEMSGVRRMTGSIAGLHPAFQGAAMNALAASPQANPFAPQGNQPQNALVGAFAGGVPSNAFAPQGNPQQQTQAPSPIQRPQSIPAEPQEAEAPPRPTPKVPDDYTPGPLQRKQEKMIENALRQKEQERMMQNELALQGPDGNFYRALQAFQQHFAGAGAAAAGAR